MSASREKHSFRLPAELMRQLDAMARTRQVSRAAIVEVALASYLSPDGAERLEAAVVRRLDRLTRQLDRIATGWRLRRVADPLIVNTAAQTAAAILAPKTIAPERLGEARDLGAALAEGLASGIF